MEHDDDELQREAPWRIDGPTPSQELYEAFPEEPAVYGVNPDDGLPQPVVPASIKLAQAAPLLRETFVCMEDTREFVIRDEYGVISHRFDPKHVSRYPDGKYRVAVGMQVPGSIEAQNELRYERGADTHLEVEPVRPQCAHYARQLTDFPDDPDYRFMVRLCTARRTDSGEFLSLRDTKMYACELRSPREHLIDERELVRSDAERVLAAERKLRRSDDETDFDPTTQAPAATEPAPRPHQPIFSDTPSDD